jgi:hypothetical protein
VKKLVVFKEAHSDRTVHFHVAVCLFQSRTWRAVKRTLRERDHLPSHFSVTHTQFWSAVRYGHIPTVKKPDVDPDPYPWTADGTELDLFAESQRPFNATMWKRRREEAVREAAADPRKKLRRFGKLDFTAIVMDKELTTKAAVMAYFQKHGSEEQQEFVSNQQRKLKDFLQDAKEWAAARADAKAERETDWALLCRTGEEECPHGPGCSYRAAAEEFFKANKATLDKVELAAALRAILVSGPSKTVRTPLLTGPSNSGKSTVVLPFDNLFNKKKVFHKPALGSSFPLANITKEKRFLFWDDYRPVEFAQETVDVSTYLSLFNGFPFEVKQSGSYHEANEDFAWHRGCLMTAKSKGLWDAYGEVSQEDVQHMKNRMYIFPCTAVIKRLKETVPCACCMSKWIVAGAAEADARVAFGAVAVQLPIASFPGGHAAVQCKVLGMPVVASRAQLPEDVSAALEAELHAAGAVHVKELTVDDWQQLACFPRLKVFQQRRLVSIVTSTCW